MSQPRDCTVEEVMDCLQNHFDVKVETIAGGTDVVLKRGRDFGTLPLGFDIVPVEVIPVTLAALKIDAASFWGHIP